MLKLVYPLTLFAMVIVLQGCNSISAEALTETKVDGTNLPGGTFDCIAPKIVTEQGKCAEPKKLSWM